MRTQKDERQLPLFDPHKLKQVLAIKSNPLTMARKAAEDVERKNI